MTPPVEPRVTVVMPVYNAERFINEAIESILRQTFTDFEFVIVDDGSSDRSLEVIRAHVDPRVRLFSNGSNLGVVQTLNRGIALALGSLIARMDADDIAMPNRLELQVGHFDKHPEVAALSGAMQLVDGGGHVGQTVSVPRDSETIRRCFAHGENPLHHPASMFRRSAFEAVGGYRRAFAHAEDLDLWLRLAERGELANLDEVVLRYRLHSAQVSFVHLEQQVVSAEGAFLAARERRAGRRDPFDGPEPVDRAVLQRLGADLARVESLIVRRFTVAANVFFAVRRGGDALVAAEALTAVAFRCGSVARKAAFEANWIRWRSHRASGEVWRALVWLVRAAPWSPKEWASRLARAVRGRLLLTGPTSGAGPGGSTEGPDNQVRRGDRHESEETCAK